MRPSLEALEAQTWWHGGPHRLTDIAYNHPRHGGLHLGTLRQAEHRGKVMTAFRLYAGCRMRLSRDRGDGWAARARDARSHGFDAILYLNRWEGLGPLDGFDDWAQADALSDRRFAALMPDASYSLIVLRQGVVRMLDLDESLALAA